VVHNDGDLLGQSKNVRQILRKKDACTSSVKKKNYDVNLWSESFSENSWLAAASSCFIHDKNTSCNDTKQ